MFEVWLVGGPQREIPLLPLPVADDPTRGESGLEPKTKKHDNPIPPFGYVCRQRFGRSRRATMITGIFTPRRDTRYLPAVQEQGTIFFSYLADHRVSCRPAISNDEDDDDDIVLDDDRLPHNTNPSEKRNKEADNNNKDDDDDENNDR